MYELLIFSNSDMASVHSDSSHFIACTCCGSVMHAIVQIAYAMGQSYTYVQIVYVVGQSYIRTDSVTLYVVGQPYVQIVYAVGHALSSNSGVVHDRSLLSTPEALLHRQSAAPPYE